jgi:hypothetical protein
MGRAEQFEDAGELNTVPASVSLGYARVSLLSII